MIFFLLSYSCVIIHLFLCYRNLAYGCAFMIFIHQLFPTVFCLGNVSMNTAMIAVLAVFVVIRNYRKMAKLPTRYTYMLKRLAFPLICLAALAPLSFKLQFNSWLQFVVTDLLPGFLILLSIRSLRDFKVVLYTLLGSYILIGIYGILTYVWHMNPIFTLFNIYYGELQDNYTGSGEEIIRGALTGAASGNTSGPLPWGQSSLVVLFAACFLPRGYKNGWLANSIIILSTLNCFLCGKRSVILPMILVIGYYIFTRYLQSTKGRIKFVMGTCMACLFMAYFVPDNGYMKNIKTSLFFWDDRLAEKNDVKGSSKDMRMEQFMYVHAMVQGSPFCGLGLGYPSYYSSRKGQHPVMLGFESIYFSVLVQSGFIGLVIWFLFFYRCYVYTKKAYFYSLDGIMVHGAYLLSLLLTGLQASLFIYVVYVCLMLKSKETPICNIPPSTI